jgi:hypothetical protein
MTGYCAHLTADDGHIMNRVAILAANDKEAIRLVDGHPVELWQEGRHIATFDPRR